MCSASSDIPLHRRTSVVTPRLRAFLHPLMMDFVDHLALCDRPYSAVTIAEALTAFLTWAQQRAVNPLAARSTDLEAYQEFLVTTYRTPQGNLLARTTAASRIAHLKRWYRWLTDRGHLVIDPARGLGIRVVSSRVVKKGCLSLQEATALVQTQSALVAAAKPGTLTHARRLRDLATVCIGLATGRRTSGIVGMTVDQIAIDRREVRIDREKGRMGRVLPVAGWAMDVVAAYLQSGRPLLTRGHETPWAFVDLTGTQPMKRLTLQLMLRKLAKATRRANPDLSDLPGKHITWHSLRVSFATLLFSHGCDIRSVNELLLHRRLSTTAAYTPIPIEDMRQVFHVAHPRP